MEQKDIKVQSLKGSRILEFYILNEALDLLPGKYIFSVPKKAKRWLEENCKGECYLITIDRELENQYLSYILEQNYIGVFSSADDALLFKLVWG